MNNYLISIVYNISTITETLSASVPVSILNGVFATDQNIYELALKILKEKEGNNIITDVISWIVFKVEW